MNSRVPTWCALMIVLLSLSSFAERIPTEAGTYRDEGMNTSVNQESPFVCPSVLKVTGSVVAVPLSASFGDLIYPYGSTSIDLGKSGSFHGVVALPSRKVAQPDSSELQNLKHKDDDNYAKSIYDKYHAFRTLDQVRIDLDTIEIGGGGHAIVFRAQLPPSAEKLFKEDHFQCRNTLVSDVIMARFAPKKGKGSKKYVFDSTYRMQTCSGDACEINRVAVVNGKVSIVGFKSYESWAVNDIPISADGRFEAEVTLAKMPPANVLEAVGYDEDKAARAQDGATLTITGKSSKKSMDVDVKTDNGQNGRVRLFPEGSSGITGSFIDCKDPANFNNHLCR